jgi:hypothetical protein
MMGREKNWRVAVSKSEKERRVMDEGCQERCD